MGAAAYDRQQRDSTLHRSVEAGCPYLENQRKSNTKGMSWMMLSPAACRADHFVGPSGTDCCSADPMQAAIDLVECRWFYPKRD